MKENGVIQEYTGSLSRQIREEYHIGEEYYHGEIKRGLRNSDGTGVMVGVTKVGSVQGYLLQDGQRIPIPGRLYYRGIELNDIVEAHRAEGTFGFEEVAYLAADGLSALAGGAAALQRDHEPGQKAAGGLHRGDDHAAHQRQHHE